MPECETAGTLDRGRAAALGLDHQPQELAGDRGEAVVQLPARFVRRQTPARPVSRPLDPKQPGTFQLYRGSGPCGLEAGYDLSSPSVAGDGATVVSSSLTDVARRSTDQSRSR